MISYHEKKHFSFLLVLFMLLCSAVFAASRPCQSHCGAVEIPYPFGIGESCYLEKSYEIECTNKTSSGKLVPFLSAIGKEVVNISLPTADNYFTSESSGLVYSLSFGLVRVKTLITSEECLNRVKESTESIMNFTGSPFFIDDTNNLIAVGCNAKVSLTHIKPNMVGCELVCDTSEDQPSNNIPFLDKTGCSSNKLSYTTYQEDCTGNKPEATACDGNGCCQVRLPNDPQQAIGIRIESNNGNSTVATTREEHCRVAFITDEVYTLSNATKPRQLFGKYATFTLRWVIQTKNHSFMSSLLCNNTKHYGHSSYLVGPDMKCICDQSTISEITYAHCGCKKGFTGNAYISDGCQGQFMFLPCVCVCVQAHDCECYKSSLDGFKSFMIFEIQTSMNAKSPPTHVEKETLVLILKETITAWLTRKKQYSQVKSLNF
ncbi:hypothetical protein Bca52824_091294 [Brassica carinata]|uniref:Uncharacterized protein n=1 Tax=Brassica carinata TaxID=52824 RepID=A0A8X7NUU2_BRACI|nr:hypothetical protein Bca52824_091294 [Brassica carinata]